MGLLLYPIDMNQPNLRKFKADFGDFKFTCSIEYTAFYILVNAAQTIRKGDTIAVTGELTFEPLPDGSTAPFKPVVTVSDL